MKSELKIDAFKKREGMSPGLPEAGHQGRWKWEDFRSLLMNCRKMRALEHKNTQPLGTSHTGRPGTSRLLTDPQGLWVETVDSLALGAAGKSGATTPEENWLLKQTNFMAFGGQLSSFEYRIYIRNNFFQYDSRIAVM